MKPDILLFKAEFSSKLSEGMTKQKISIRKLAKDLVLSPTYIAKIKSGSEIPSYLVYAKLCTIFGIEAISPINYPQKSYSALQSQNEKYKQMIDFLISCELFKENFSSESDYNKKYSEIYKHAEKQATEELIIEKER